MRLWTIQKLNAWREATRRGVLRADARYSARSFRVAYLWLVEQFTARVPDYTGRFPIWAWTEKPDLRFGGHLPRDEHGVVIEFEAPAARVLLSDFDAWHCVLNRMPIYLREHDYDRWFRRPRRGEDAASLAHARKTWPLVFELAALRQSDAWGVQVIRRGKAQTVQATLEEVLLDEIISVRKFVAR